MASFFVLASCAAAPLAASAVAGTPGAYTSLLAGLVVTSTVAGAAGWFATRSAGLLRRPPAVGADPAGAGHG